MSKTQEREDFVSKRAAVSADFELQKFMSALAIYKGELDLVALILCKLSAEMKFALKHNTVGMLLMVAAVCLRGLQKASKTSS